MQKETAIILINWNGFFHSNNCIESIYDSGAVNYDIILLDNASSDGSGEKLKEKFPGIILLQANSNLGFSGGNNIALQYAVEKGYTYSFLLNNDTFVHPGFLKPLALYMQEHPNTGALQPKIFFHCNKEILWNGGSIYNQWLGYTRSHRYKRREGKRQQRVQQVDWITGCAFFIRNSVLAQTGLFARNMFMYFEDTDLSMRILILGYQLAFQPQSIIYHVAGASNTSKEKTAEGYSNPTVYYYNFRNRIWFLKKYTPYYCLPGVFLYNLLYFAAFLAYFLIRGRLQKSKAVCKAIRDGLGGEIQYS